MKYSHSTPFDTTASQQQAKESDFLSKRTEEWETVPREIFAEYVTVAYAIRNRQDLIRNQLITSETAYQAEYAEVLTAVQATLDSGKKQASLADIKAFLRSKHHETLLEMWLDAETLYIEADFESAWDYLQAWTLFGASPREERANNRREPILDEAYNAYISIENRLDLTPNQRLLLSFVYRFSDKQTGIAKVTLAMLQAKYGCTRRNIQLLLKAIHDKGLLDRVEIQHGVYALKVNLTKLRAEAEFYRDAVWNSFEQNRKENGTYQDYLTNKDKAINKGFSRQDRQAILDSISEQEEQRLVYQASRQNRFGFA